MEVRDLFLSPHLSPEEVKDFLSQFGFERPEEADRHLQRMADALPYRERFAEFGSLLLAQAAAAADPDAALLQMEAFLEAVPSPPNLIYYLEEHPVALEVLCQILGASPYLTQILLRNPEYFYWLMEGKRLEVVQEADYFRQQAAQAVSPLENPERALDALRRMRRRENLRIAAQDILHWSEFQGTVQQISYLADTVLQSAFEILADRRLPSLRGFAVLALGKLGGVELNFSSDVDLLYVYADECDRGQIFKFAREYTRALTTYTNEGHLYRVDLRLRPMGTTGEIATSLDAARQYYEHWADTFDRLALLKIRPVAGDLELGERFASALQDFIFKTYMDKAAVEEIRWVKRRIDRTLQRRESARNIKLGAGGIREVEFFVQAFQLLYGGTIAELRTPNTLAALDRLLDHALITAEDHQTLRAAYIFLRDLEHKLQLVHDRQTHELPEEDWELARCARRMGYRGEGWTPLAAFNRELSAHTAAVRRVFESLFEAGPRPAALEELVLNPELGRDEAVRRLSREGFRHAEEIYEGFKLLEQAPSFPHSPTRTRNLLANLAPLLTPAAEMTRHPRLLFSRFDRFCNSLGSRATLYAALVENPNFAETFLRVLASGDFLSETLIRNPELLDAISLPGRRAASFEALQSFVAQQTASGTEPRNALRRFKQREEFKIALADLATPLNQDTRGELAKLAELCLHFACRRALEKLSALQSEQFTLLGLGKLGGRELTYHSDLDLVLLYEQSATESLPVKFNDFLRELKEELESYTELGRAYTIDFRLRPEGKHGPLAVPGSSFQKYFEERAEAWERLAYVKARPIFIHGAEMDVERRVFRKFSESELRELARIRKRKELEIGQEKQRNRFDFKVGRGGLMDIQFAAQYLQIQHGVPEPNTRCALNQLVKAGYLDQESGTTLTEGLEFLFAIETIQRLLEETSTTSFASEPTNNDVLARFLGFDSGGAFVERYLRVTEEIRRIYERLVAAGL